MASDPSGTPPAVLSFVSDPALRQSIRAVLAAAGWNVVEESRVAEALSSCRSNRPELAFVECACEGARAFAEGLAGGAATPWIAIGDAAACEAALAAGAADWILAPVSGPLLVHRAARARIAARAESSLADGRSTGAFAEDSDESASDLPPREDFLLRAESVLNDAGQRPKSAGILAIAVEVADAPPESGALEACLPLLARRMRDALRARDGLGSAHGRSGPVALLADREFAVLLERQERPQDAYKVARRLQQQLEKPVDAQGRRWNLRVHVGIAMQAHDGATAAELFEAARQALISAREEQLHGIRFATAAMNAATQERLTLESNLRYALERGELALHYQPRIDLGTGAVVGFEALLRWKHPEIGMIPPGQFVPIAEETGLIIPIGEWVLHEACRQNQAWRAAGLPRIRMAVNISAVQFRQPDLDLRIARVLEDTGLDPDGLEIELTESLLLQDAEATIQALQAIRAMGVRLSIDDFGTGYSSLSYIKRFPMHSLKVDQSFVRQVLTSPEDSAITTSIVLMGKSLKLTVVAEGVETRSQLEFLRVLECDEAQGYLFSRPVPAAEAVECLRTGYAAILNPGAPTTSR